jgi:hypothetical protein
LGALVDRVFWSVVVVAIAAGNDLDLVLTGLTRDRLGRLTPRQPLAKPGATGWYSTPGRGTHARSETDAHGTQAAPRQSRPAAD